MKQEEFLVNILIYYLFVNLNIVYIQNITNKRKKTNKNKKKGV